MIKIICVGKLKEKYLKDGIDEYIKRLKRFSDIEIIELNDEKTINVLREFVGLNGDVIQVYDSNLLQKIIKIIVITASKVKSKSLSVHRQKGVSVTRELQQEIQTAINEVEDWEW